MIDEVAGMLVTLFLVPVGWAGAIGAFLLFRLSDIVKPYPANRLERLPGGLGIMADDVMAGVYANLALRLCLWSLIWSSRSSGASGSHLPIALLNDQMTR